MVKNPGIDVGRATQCLRHPFSVGDVSPEGDQSSQLFEHARPTRTTSRNCLHDVAPGVAPAGHPQTKSHQTTIMGNKASTSFQWATCHPFKERAKDVRQIDRLLLRATISGYATDLPVKVRHRFV